MALSDDQVLSDAKELVTDLVTTFDAMDLSSEDSEAALQDVIRILNVSEQIVEIMLAKREEAKRLASLPITVH